MQMLSQIAKNPIALLRGICYTETKKQWYFHHEGG